MSEFLAGASVVACLLIGLFFLRFWRETHDRLFAIFALAFWVFAGNRLLLGILDEHDENRAYVYVARAVAFGLIAFAIYDKNRTARRRLAGER